MNVSGCYISEGDNISEEENTKGAIPAYTSIEKAAKHIRGGTKSVDRYINENMESELEAYKEEIEHRYKKSSINKGYIFPRVARN
jgi:hypothetical protein